MNRTKRSERKEEKESKLPFKKGIVAIERRQHPRLNLELPMDYVRVNSNENYGGIVANASEVGILVYLPEKVEMGTVLKIEIFYEKGAALDSIRAIARVVWYDLPARKRWGERRYGLRFKSIDKRNFDKLQKLLRERVKTKG
ncbi:MAG: PilZ domain-containing protein [Syntrophaceae bacterium]|nr:PilZ domain-containing protein [Syntrophaceae bacterium]